jgi:hypothetical protein
MNAQEAIQYTVTRIMALVFGGCALVVFEECCTIITTLLALLSGLFGALVGYMLTDNSSTIGDRTFAVLFVILLVWKTVELW